MLHITAFGTIIFFASGGRWFRTLDREHLRDVLEACGGEKASSENQFVHWVDEADPDNPKNWPFIYKASFLDYQDPPHLPSEQTDFR